MKRLIYCLDGTSNVYDADFPINVVMMYKSIAAFDGDIQQITYYDEGVGAKFGEWIRGGAFGRGLLKNIMEAYEHLCKHYEVGDEIYIFGFSRGAYTARSLAGLIGWCGILDKPTHVLIMEAKAHYKRRLLKDKGHEEEFNKWRMDHCSSTCANQADLDYRSECISDPSLIPKIVSIQYIGVWDTVRTLGLTDRRLKWHDHDLSERVLYARHAIAIDERRKKFNVIEWDNIQNLNAIASKQGRVDELYSQKWFPGVHGSVGGGGPVRGLSDNAFEWIKRGAEKAGLKFTELGDTAIFELKPNALDWLNNGVGLPITVIDKVKGFVYKLTGTIDRKGPSQVEDLDHSVLVRFFASPEFLPEKSQYRPDTLSQIFSPLESMSAPFDEADYRSLIENTKKDILAEDEQKIVTISNKKFVVHVVKKGETLSRIAKNITGDVSNWKKIHEYNQASIPNPNLIYIGQRIFIPVEFVSLSS